MHIGGPDPWHNWGGPAKVGALKSVLCTESSLVVKIKNTWLILFAKNYQNLVIRLNLCCFYLPNIEFF